MLRLLFVATLFVSATLLFVVQPMIAKMVLPLLGGTPAVWITCMVFFQAMLLAGYLYAHLSTSWLGTRKQAAVHVVLLLLPLAALPLMLLPLHLASGNSTALPTAQRLLGSIPAVGNPTLWLLGLLLVCIGLPFFAVSTSAPLLQKWFAATGHPDAVDPYFLYGASNLGSMLALLGYPFAIEPFLNLQTQSHTWSAGYGLLVALTALCAFAMRRAAGASAAPTEPIVHPQVLGERVTVLRRVHWIVLAFVPSSLLLGVTTYMSTDLAAIPLLWVIPLALYLLTFILAFGRRSLSTNWMAWTLPALMILQLVVLFQPLPIIWPTLVLHLVTLFVASLLCHTELAARRPQTAHLTEFYLWMSFGGVLGGLFSAVLAPMIFKTVIEYPLELTLACMLGPPVQRAVTPWTTRLRRSPYLNLGLPILAGVGGGLMIIYLVLPRREPGTWGTWLAGPGLVVVEAFLVYVAVTLCTFRPLLIGLSIGLVLLGDSLGQTPVADATLLYQERTFFGVLRVYDFPKEKLRRFYHGTTLHGAQSLDPQRRDEPLTYYHRQGPLGNIFDMVAKKPPQPLAIVGLGTGTIACYGRPKQEMDFFDIDPAVVGVADNDFTYLHDSPATTHVTLGDGRLSLARTDKTYGMIILDAFSSDAIPVHLLTTQAVQNVYLPHLAADGLILFHITNRYLDLSAVIGDIASATGLSARIRMDPGDPKVNKADTIWVVLARAPQTLETLDEAWPELNGDASQAWTDDFSNVVQIVRWQGKPLQPTGQNATPVHGHGARHNGK